MRGVREGDRREAVVALFVVFISAGACAHRPHQPGPETPVPVESPTTVQAPPPQPVYTGPLRLYEVRVSETAGQRSILFRFSRPPEGIDYFPLRSPSRLVIDVKAQSNRSPKSAATRLLTHWCPECELVAIRAVCDLW